MIEKVIEFHEKFGHGIASIQGTDERSLTMEEKETIMLRRKLIMEEFEELISAPYLDEVMKEACDLLYVVLGMFVEFGWDVEEAFSRVHESNMSKLGDDGNPIYREDGKVLKGPNYEKADLSDLV
jgi:phosphoribosyl-ATP pyrophosphohydrolase